MTDGDFAMLLNETPFLLTKEIGFMFGSLTTNEFVYDCMFVLPRFDQSTTCLVSFNPSFSLSLFLLHVFSTLSHTNARMSLFAFCIVLYCVGDPCAPTC
jgi:hypothetical protein